MLKQSFSDALKGIFIGLILSIFFSYLFSPDLYLPLSPNSTVGRWMFLHHGRLVPSTTRILPLAHCRIHPRLCGHLVGLLSFLQKTSTRNQSKHY